MGSLSPHRASRTDRNRFAPGFHRKFDAIARLGTRILIAGAHLEKVHGRQAQLMLGAAYLARGFDHRCHFLHSRPILVGNCYRAGADDAPVGFFLHLWDAVPPKSNHSSWRLTGLKTVSQWWQKKLSFQACFRWSNAFHSSCRSRAISASNAAETLANTKIGKPNRAMAAMTFKGQARWVVSGTSELEGTAVLSYLTKPAGS